MLLRIIKLLASFNEESESIGYKININTETNKEDTFTLVFFPTSGWIKIRYTKEGITDGKLNVKGVYE